MSNDNKTPKATRQKIVSYAWMSAPEVINDIELSNQYIALKKRGIDGLLYSAGHNPFVYERIGRLVKDAGLEFQAWIPTLMQGANAKIDKSWYVVNRKGESAWDKPAYVEHYKFLCPNREEVYQFLEDLYISIAKVDEIDAIHLDHIRFPDVILGRGLWDRYGLVMDKEYPQFDYCYCNKCTGDFKARSGIDVKSVDDPTELEEWKQFRYDSVTNLVNRLAEAVHSIKKRISAAVFPGPESIAKKIVRQEWNKWNVDQLFPMNYNDLYLETVQWIGQVCKEETTSIDKQKPIYSGLLISPVSSINQKEMIYDHYGLAPEDIEQAINLSLENGCCGICLFNPERMTQEHWKIFEKVIKNNIPE